MYSNVNEYESYFNRLTSEESARPAGKPTVYRNQSPKAPSIMLSSSSSLTSRVGEEPQEEEPGQEQEQDQDHDQDQGQGQEQGKAAAAAAAAAGSGEEARVLPQLQDQEQGKAAAAAAWSGEEERVLPQLPSDAMSERMQSLPELRASPDPNTFDRRQSSSLPFPGDTPASWAGGAGRGVGRTELPENAFDDVFV